MFPLPEAPLVEEEFPDNVYADSKPPNPLKSKGTITEIKTTQTFSRETIHGDSFDINEDYYRSNVDFSKKVRHRKRRNPYYNAVDDEDEDGFTESDPQINKLGVIYEEDEHGRKVRKSMYNESDSDYENASMVPINRPDPKSHGFNEHSIMGEFDKDEKGNIILLTNEKGNLVCKNGRKVNEKGYLRDRYGHILYANKGRVRAFAENDLDERGEIPLPYSYDRYNFNAFDVLGNIAVNPATGSPKRYEHKRGESLTDENGFLFNSKGYLTDSNGNMISRTDGEIKLDKWQLTKDGDIPMLYTYDARKFHIKQCMGEFDRDEEGHIIVLTEIDEDGNSQFVDKRGKSVNQKGYTVDGEIGNIITQDGVQLFANFELGPGGEIPKILPYTKFDVDEIKGDLEKNENGKIKVIHENEKGEILDNQKRRVNAKGYLIDNEGNILDQKGNRVFDCELIDETGEIPKVFRIGLLRSDSTTSLNRFLEEIEKIKDNLGLGGNDLDSNFEEEEKLLENSEGEIFKTKHSSENNSAMGDRPSNYNTANMENIQNFIKKKEHNIETSSQSSDDFDVEDPEFLEAIKERKIRRKRKIKYKRPNKKDIRLANAYGGEPRGAKIVKDPKLSSARSSKQKLATVGAFAGKSNSKMAKNDFRQDTVSIMGDSAIENRRDRPETKSSRKTLDVETKLNSKIGNDTRLGKMIEKSELGLNSVTDGQNNKGFGSTIILDNQNPDIISQNSSSHPRAKSKPQHLKRHFGKKKSRKGKNKDMVSVAPSDLDKLYGKDVDDFLNESDWDINSDNNRSQLSYKSARSYGDKRIRGLESIYLQRLEAGVKKKKSKKKKPRFRALQDRYLNEDEIPRDDEFTSSIFSEDKNKKDSYFD